MADSDLDLVVAGTADAVLMVESEAKSFRKMVMLGAVTFGLKGWQPVIEAIIKLAEKAAKEPRDFAPAICRMSRRLVLRVAETDLRAAYKITQKQERYAAVDAAKAKVFGDLCPRVLRSTTCMFFEKEQVKAVFKKSGQDRALEHP